jgi:hypothetical protein
MWVTLWDAEPDLLRAASLKARPGPLPEVRRTARWADMGEEPGGRGLDVHVHDPGASG